MATDPARHRFASVISIALKSFWQWQEARKVSEKKTTSTLASPCAPGEHLSCLELLTFRFCEYICSSVSRDDTGMIAQNRRLGIEVQQLSVSPVRDQRFRSVPCCEACGCNHIWGLPRGNVRPKQKTLYERVGIQEWFTGEVNTGTVAAEAEGSIRGTRIPYRAPGIPYRFTQWRKWRRGSKVK